MRLRYQYLVVGVLWALLLAPLAALSVLAYAAGVSWLWLHGDSPWPASTGMALPLIGFAAGIAVAILCLRFAFRYGLEREKESAAGSRREQTRILLAGAAPIVIALMLGTKYWLDERSYSQAMTVAAQREASFVSLAGDIQKISALNVTSGDGASFTATVRLSGKRDGAYGLNWQVDGTSFNGALAKGVRRITLGKGENQEEIRFTLKDLADGYRRHLSGSGEVLVDERFHLLVQAEPSLSEADRNTLPPGEQRRLETGDSDLRSAKTIDFPVRFFIHRDGTVSR